MTRADIEFVVGKLANITLHSSLLERIKEAQMSDLLGNRASHPIGFSDIRIAAEYNSNIKTF